MFLSFRLLPFGFMMGIQAGAGPHVNLFLGCPVVRFSGMRGTNFWLPCWSEHGMKSHTGLRSASHTLDSHWLEIGELFPRAARFESVCCIQPWSHVVAGPLPH
jgi:hypothetical protein